MKEFFKNLKFVWKYAKKQKLSLYAFVFCSIISIFVGVVIPIISSKVIVNLSNGIIEELIMMSIVLFLVESFRTILWYFINIFSQKIFRHTSILIKSEISNEILKLESKVLEKNGTGVFLQRLNNDTDTLSYVFTILVSNVSNIVMDIGIFVVVFAINRIVFLFLMVPVVILFLLEKVRSDEWVNQDKIFRKKAEKTSGLASELVRGVRDIKMLNAENSFMKEFKSVIIDINNLNYKMQKINGKFYMVEDFAEDFSKLLLMFLLAFFISRDIIATATTIVIYNYFTKVLDMVPTIRNLVNGVKNFNLSSSRVFEVIDSKEFSKESFGNVHLDHVNGDFEFKNVSFKYDKTRVLDNLSFKVNANETVAFVGKSGAGKTTIFNLLCKMYEPNKGTITIDGVNIKKLDKDTIRGNITIISQNPYIFNMTIRENLKLVKEDLTEEDMINACKMACLHDFIMEQPLGYDTMFSNLC